MRELMRMLLGAIIVSPEKPKLATLLNILSLFFFFKIKFVMAYFFILEGPTLQERNTSIMAYVSKIFFLNTVILERIIKKI